MGAVLKIDLDGIIENIIEYKKRIGDSRFFCAVVKADAYGLGSKKICKAINDFIDYFAVSSKREFLEIKKLVSKPILLLSPIYENITILAKSSCEFCISNIFQLERFLKLAKRSKNVVYNVHIAINSGMNRFGFSGLSEINYAINKIQKTQNIKIKGVFSHYYIGNNEIISKMQSKRLESVKSLFGIEKKQLKPIFHIANTDGFEFGRNFDMIRIGLGLFLKNNKNTFSLVSKVIEIQSIKPNETVGYGLKFIAEKNMRVAVVSIGYADGIMRRIAGKGYVLINGKFSKILAVCMDCIIVDITGLKANLCDEVTLVGKNGDNQIFICDIAKWCDTIEYEIMTRFSKRIKRVYVGGNDYANNHWKIQGEKTCCGG